MFEHDVLFLFDFRDVGVHVTSGLTRQGDPLQGAGGRSQL